MNINKKDVVSSVINGTWCVYRSHHHQHNEIYAIETMYLNTDIRLSVDISIQKDGSAYILPYGISLLGFSYKVPSWPWSNKERLIINRLKTSLGVIPITEYMGKRVTYRPFKSQVQLNNDHRKRL